MLADMMRVHTIYAGRQVQAMQVGRPADVGHAWHGVVWGVLEGPVWRHSQSIDQQEGDTSQTPCCSTPAPPSTDTAHSGDSRLAPSMDKFNEGTGWDSNGGYHRGGTSMTSTPHEVEVRIGVSSTGTRQTKA